MVDRPNFLFLLPDQHRADWIGCVTDLPLRTPNIDRLAVEGTRFTHAMTPSPVCSPARACLATGMDYDRCGTANNNENTPLAKKTYYQALRVAGYQVAGVGKFDLHKADLDWGLDGKNMLDEYGFTDGIDSEGKGDAIWAYRKAGKPGGPYIKFLDDRGCLKEHQAMYDAGSDDLLFEAITELPDDAYCDNWIAQNGLEQLASFSKAQPWHLVVNFAGPHDPYDVTQSMRDRWSNVEFPAPSSNNVDDPAVILLRQQNYAAMIENIDSLIGRYLALLKERGELENTIIVYSSDHGEMLGEHNRWQKSIWYDGAVRVPLVVKGPGVPPSLQSGETSRCPSYVSRATEGTSDSAQELRRDRQVSGALVSFHDIGATFLDYAGVDAQPGADARSFRKVLEGDKTRHRDVLKSGLNDWRMVFDGRLKLVIRQEEGPLLFDLREDPEEIENLAERFPCKVQKLEGCLAIDPH